MSFKIFCVFLFLFSSISRVQTCLLPGEIAGNCSSCSATQLLQNGNCYEKLRGCLEQQLSSCIICQNGYVLSNKICIKEADYYGLNSLNPPPSTIIDSALNISSIKPIYVGGYTKTTNFNNPFYITALHQLYLGYPYLKPFTIINVEEQVVSGMNYIIYMLDQKLGDSYSAQIYVNLSNVAVINTVYKNQNLVTIGQNQSNSQNDSFSGEWNIFTNYTDSKYIDSKNALFSLYPELFNYNITKVQYQIVAGINYLIYLQNQNDLSTFVAEVFDPIYGDVQILNTWQNSTTTHSIAGGYDTLSGNYSSNQFYVLAYNAAINSYPQLKICLVTKVQQQIVSGSNYIINFVSTNSSDTYQVKVYVPLPYTQQPPSITYILKNSQNYTTNNNLNLTSTNNSTNSSPQVGNYQNLDGNFTTNPMYIKALSTLKNTYSVLNKTVVVKVQQQIVAGANYIINFQQINSSNTFQAKVFVPLPYTQLPPQIKYILKNGQNYSNQILNVSLTSNTSTSNPMSGGYQVLIDYSSNPSYIAALSASTSTYPVLKNAIVAKVQEQIVAGSNFIINFQSSISTDNYQVKVFIPLPYTQLPPQIKYILKNGQVYSTTNTSTSLGQVYNWQTDSIFSNMYNYFKAEISIINLTPIVDVIRTQKSNQGISYLEYKIIYSSSEYGIVRNYPEINKFQAISYIADVTDIYQLTKKPVSLSQKTEYNLQRIIQNYNNSTKFSNILIQNVQCIPLQSSFKVYIVNFTIQDGTYQTKILDDGTASIYNVVKINNSTCFEISFMQAAIPTHQEYVRDQLIVFLKSKYNFTGYSSTLSVVNYNSNGSIDYRLIFTRSDYKTVVAKIQGVLDKYSIKELSLLYEGLAIINSTAPQSINVTNIARSSIYSPILKTADLVSIKYNGQKYQIIFADSSRLYNYTVFNLTTNMTLQSTIFSGEVACQNTNNTICSSCGTNQILWHGKCYPKQQNCDIQAGNLCVICSNKSIFSKGNCLSNCSQIFS